MARPVNPNTPYIVRSGDFKGDYAYVYVQRRLKVKKYSEPQRRKLNIGKITRDKVFIPNNAFRLMSIDERRKFIFPDDWDISDAMKRDLFNYGWNPGLTATDNENDPTDAAKDSGNPSNKEETARSEEKDVVEQVIAGSTNQNEQAEEPGISSKQENSEVSIPDNRHTDLEIAQILALRSQGTTVYTDYTSKIYGNIWLLEQIARAKGVEADLIEVFNGDIGAVNDILTMAIYTIVEKRSFNRLDRWLDTHKAPSDHRFRADYVTKFTQTITDDHRMRFIQCRIKRQPEGAISSIDSTSRSGYSKCLVDLKWGKNKDREDLPCSLEVYVYSLTTHEPIYYRRLAGNTSDMVTIRTILADLKALGISVKNLMFMTDRGYCSVENMGMYHELDTPFLMGAKTGQKPVIEVLMKIEYDQFGLPDNMEFDSESGLYYYQGVADDFEVILENGDRHIVSGIKVNAFMNPTRRILEARKVKSDVNEEKELVRAMQSGEKKYPDNERKFRLKYHNIKRIKDSAIPEITINQSAIDKEYAQCGFFASCMYKKDISAIEAYREYSKRDEHEKNFFCLKDDESAEMQDCSSEEGVSGRNFVYFVATILNDVLKHTWKTKLKPRFSTSYEVLDTMETIKYSEYVNGDTHMTTFTGEQITVCDAFDIEPPQACMTNLEKEKWRRAHSPMKRGRKRKEEKKSDEKSTLESQSEL